LAIAYTRLEAELYTPLGLSNKYRALLFAFLDVVSIIGLSPLSDALVYRRKHNDIVVILDKVKLFRGSDRERSEYITT
jgi:hypothetical protein